METMRSIFLPPSCASSTRSSITSSLTSERTVITERVPVAAIASPTSIVNRRNILRLSDVRIGVGRFIEFC